MNRYLIRISYIGTNFKSFTKTISNGVPATPTTVGVIEEALQLLKPVNPIKVYTVSRTDTGVHALNSAVVVDLQRQNGKPYDGHYITSILNDSFEEKSHAVRINRADVVPNSFNQHVNAVKSRTYLYRFGIIRKNLQIHSQLEEQYRCHFLNIDEFDMERFREAAQMFLGKHDFRTFLTINNDTHLRPSFATRKINYIKIEPSRPHTIQSLDRDCNIQYWDIVINAPSFLYRQIRRMMGTFVAAAQHRITLRDVYEMLTIPSNTEFLNRINVVPAHGLYLVDIEFRPKCLLYDIIERPDRIKR